MNYERNLKYFQKVDLKGTLIAMAIGAVLPLSVSPVPQKH